MDFICSGKLESAWDIIKKNDISWDELDYHKAFKGLEESLESEIDFGNNRAANRLKRRIHSLETFQEYGLVPQQSIASANLPEEYHGKILLIQIVGGAAHGMVCLRTGDDWHREILRNTKEEIQDLGFENADVVPLGGAWVQSEPDGTITVYGSSEEFGACDKRLAADLISHAFPGNRILTHH
jgi:hypothetical protein